MTEAQQGNKNFETTQEQVVKDAHVTISTVSKKTEVLVTSSSRLSDLTSKFLNFLNIPQTDAEIVSPLDVHVHHEVPRIQVPTLLTIQVSVIPESSPLIKESHDEVTLAKVSYQPQFTYEVASTLTEFELKKILLDKMEKSESYLTALEHRDCYDGLKKSYALDKDFFYSYYVCSLKRGQKDKDKDEDPSAGSNQGLKKRKTSKDIEPTNEEPVFEVADSDMPQDHTGKLGDNEDEPRDETTSRRDWFKKPTPPQEPTDPDCNDFDELMNTLIDFSGYILNGLKIENLTQEVLLGHAFRLLKGTRSSYAELEYDFEECYKALSEKLDWENPKGGDYPFNLSKPIPLITRGNRQRVPFKFFINNDLKYLQGGFSTMTYTTSTTMTKATPYDLPGIEDMVSNIWSHVKVDYDKYAIWGISHWREQRKCFYAFARGMQSRGDVYSTKRILAVTHVLVMRKHRYGYLEEIVVRRADNALYRFKEGDFPLLRINDIEDMLLLVVQNRLTNLSGDDVADFAIALRILTKSLVIQKRVEDLQLGVENDHKRNRLLRSDELYKFSDGTLTRLLSSLEDITKNIDMEYLPKRRWSNLEKKRAHFIINDINKLLKERRMMRSLEKFVGGRLYGIDIRLLQRII
ncbi:hypothetical protein Tco_1067208 [Tanacetum coccineum]|uniref:Uncharacterized protein n=1 Tax=Tanacetum coccineum TaxID=301880 RepID=A0ABQ5HC78_9ASTR